MVKVLLTVTLLLSMILSVSVCQQRRDQRNAPSQSQRPAVPVTFNRARDIYTSQTPRKDTPPSRRVRQNNPLGFPGQKEVNSSNNPPQRNPNPGSDNTGQQGLQLGTRGERTVAPPAPRKAFRTTEAPLCTGDSDSSLPCEVDSDYDQDIQTRFRDLLLDGPLNNIVLDPTVRQLLNDSGVVRDKTLNPGSGVSTRSGFVTETPACQAQESIIYPQRAKTTQNDWAFVLNQDSVKQGVRVEKCLREGKRCSLGTDIPPTVETICRQKFIYRKLLVLSGSGANIQPESVLIPSCCVCYIRRLDNLNLGRFAGNNSRPQGQQPSVSAAMDMGN